MFKLERNIWLSFCSLDDLQITTKHSYKILYNRENIMTFKLEESYYTDF